MASNFSFNTKGLFEFLEEIDRYPEKIDSMIKETLEEGASIIIDDANSRISESGVGMSIKGNVDKSEIITTNKSDSIHIGVFWDSKIPGVKNNPELFYAPYVEYGTVKMTAKPFLTPSWQKNKKKALKLMQKKFKEVLSR